MKAGTVVAFGLSAAALLAGGIGARSPILADSSYVNAYIPYTPREAAKWGLSFYVAPEVAIAHHISYFHKFSELAQHYSSPEIMEMVGEGSLSVVRYHPGSGDYKLERGHPTSLEALAAKNPYLAADRPLLERGQWKAMVTRTR